MSNTKNSRTSSVAESLFNKEAYFSIVVIWTLIMLRDCLGHKGISFHFDVNQFFEICLLLVPTAFISSKKIIKNVKVNTIFNKRVVTTLIIICSFYCSRYDYYSYFKPLFYSFKFHRSSPTYYIIQYDRITIYYKWFI